MPEAAAGESHGGNNVAERVPSKRGTGQFMRMGHTAHIFGNDPSVDAKGSITSPPRDLKA